MPAITEKEKKFRKEIKEVIKDCKKGIKECEANDNDDSLIYQGWVEGLEFVLNLLKKK